MGTLGLAPPQGLPKGGGGSGVTVKEDGSSLGSFTTINFSTGVTAADAGGGEATITASGGTIDHTVIGGQTTIIKSTAESVASSASLQSDDDLSFAVLSGRTYYLELSVNLDFGAIGGYRIGVGGTCTIGGSELFTGQVLIHSPSAFQAAGALLLASNDALIINWSPGATNHNVLLWTKITITGDGNLTVRWAQNVSDAGATSMRAGSRATLVRLT